MAKQVFRFLHAAFGDVFAHTSSGFLFEFGSGICPAFADMCRNLRHGAAWTACHRAVQAVAFFYCMRLNNGAQPFTALLGLYP